MHEEMERFHHNTTSFESGMVKLTAHVHSYPCVLKAMSIVCIKNTTSITYKLIEALSLNLQNNILEKFRAHTYSCASMI